jgi:hypothetical protein
LPPSGGSSKLGPRQRPHAAALSGSLLQWGRVSDPTAALSGSPLKASGSAGGYLLLLIAGLAVINASGTFSQLTAAHVGSRAVSSAALTMRGSDLDSRIEVAAAKLADLDRRLASLDGIVAGAAQRGRANTAASIMADQKKARAALVTERERAAQALADLKVERGSVQARAAIAESEAMPLRYAAELIGVGADSERALRWLIALMVLTCDPLAIALTAAVSARRLSTA